MSSLVASRSALVKIFLPDLEFPTLAAENALACLEFDARAQDPRRKLIRRNEEQPLCFGRVYWGLGKAPAHTIRDWVSGNSLTL